ncbi:hypothetical protein ACCUM_2380 [Candidatus Accumulibacter phosphatis]|uniref:Uncharacterized protein n=1 Tax=Candidatus Accumulibacter phosphatis TaxID=327160 RepID=A0A5S4ERF7_9PROT|nr:hypothetical protein ACCUM_2380 [Candidatus Accumulibacter phosphatis]
MCRGLRRRAGSPGNAPGEGPPSGPSKAWTGWRKGGKGIGETAGWQARHLFVLDNLRACRKYKRAIRGCQAISVVLSMTKSEKLSIRTRPAGERDRKIGAAHAQPAEAFDALPGRGGTGGAAALSRGRAPALPRCPARQRHHVRGRVRRSANPRPTAAAPSRSTAAGAPHRHRRVPPGSPATETKWKHQTSNIHRNLVRNTDRIPCLRLAGTLNLLFAPHQGREA